MRRISMNWKMIISAGVLVLFAGNLYAATTDCDAYQDNGDRMKCKHGKLLEQQGLLIDKLGNHFGEFVPNDIKRLKNAQARAENAEKRTTAKDFKKIGRKRPQACDIAEIDEPKSDGDGICEPGERCLEINDDGIGNDDGVCKLKGNNKEVCACIGGGPEDEVMDDDTDPEYQADMEQSYDDVTKLLEAANETVEVEGEFLSAMAMSTISGTEQSNPCAASADWLKYSEIMTLTILKQVAVGLRGIADIAERGCDQTGAGFNCSSCCVVAEGLAAVAALAVETTDGIFQLIKWGVDSSKQDCLSSLYEDVHGNKASLTGIKVVLGPPPDPPIPGGMSQGVADLIDDVKALQQQITDLETVLNSRFDETKEILLTPHGQRDKIDE
jgi:hypothetical protein